MKKQVIHLFYCTTAALLITIVPAQCMERKNIYDAIVEQLRIDIKKKTIEVESLSKKLSKVYEHFIDKVYLKKASYKMLAAKLAEKTGSRTWFSIADVKDAAVEDLDEDIDDFLKNFTIKDITFNPKTGAPEWTKEKTDEYNALVKSIKNHPALMSYEEEKSALLKHLRIGLDTKRYNLNNKLEERAQSAAKEQQKATEPQSEKITKAQQEWPKEKIEELENETYDAWMNAADNFVFDLTVDDLVIANNGYRLADKTADLINTFNIVGERLATGEKRQFQPINARNAMVQLMYNENEKSKQWTPQDVQQVSGSQMDKERAFNNFLSKLTRKDYQDINNGILTDENQKLVNAFNIYWSTYHSLTPKKRAQQILAEEQEKTAEPKTEYFRASWASWRNWKNFDDLPRDKQTLLAEWQDFLHNLVYEHYTSRDPSKKPYEAPEEAKLEKEKEKIKDWFCAALCNAWNKMPTKEFDANYEKRKAEIMNAGKNFIL